MSTPTTHPVGPVERPRTSSGPTGPTGPTGREGAYECPLCGTDFAGAECHSSCPMSRGCTMVRCPHCAYEFVESGRFADMLRRWIRRAPECSSRVSNNGTMCVADLPVGATAAVDSIRPTTAARLNRLASYGIIPGSEVRLIARKPVIVLGCGSASVALDDEIGREIFVRPDSSEPILPPGA